MTKGADGVIFNIQRYSIHEGYSRIHPGGIGDIPSCLSPSNHRLGESKREQLETHHTPPGIIPPGDEYVESLKTVFESQGLTVMIGG